MPSAGLPLRRVVQLAALFTLLVLFAAQLAGALLAYVPLFVVASAGGVALDLYLQQRQPGLIAVLGKVRFEAVSRQLLRDMLIVVALVRLPKVNAMEERALVLLLLGCYGLHFLCQAVSVLVRRNRTLPILTRNIDTSGLRLSPAPPRVLARLQSRRLLTFMLPATAGLLTTSATAQNVWALAGLAASLALFVGGTVYLGTWLLPKKRTPGEARVLNWLNAWLADYRPTVGMYFSGGATSAYQANMWLGTLAELDAKPIIVLRERFMVQKIDATDVPIISIPKVAHLMHLEQSTLKVLLHPANSGKTSQVLRIPTIKHAFTNHGESDKLSSCNPYAKAYDEVWVAGPAARDRYQLADIGIDDRDVVEVGRPQLAPITPYAGPPADGTRTTVLYAPTWEGWTDDPGNTSVILAGENIVRELLADPGVRLLYKPHPMTGSVDPRAGAADRRIRTMIAEANERRGAGSAVAPGAAAELARRTAALDALTTTSFRGSADEAERMLLQSRPEEGRAEAVAAATAAWEEAYWASFPEDEHLVVTAARPGIYGCFNQADLLISDVSSVVSDYLSSEKPYAVANTSGRSEADFRANFPTVRAATILSPEAKEVPGLLAAVRDPGKDAFAAARGELKQHLLGPSDPPSLARFNRAALDLCDAADARNRRAAARAAAEFPGQRAVEETADHEVVVDDEAEATAEAASDAAEATELVEVSEGPEAGEAQQRTADATETADDEEAGAETGSEQVRS
ncbi:hypothetical protein RM572_01860 [Streptomyces sp. DSM 42041]|uniref:Integral membrane protein n=1 Tax=Streptomyces hazeniae TaxID=3075538 RepID=A0ABU2NKK4_9ACTN|nr:hypothetical protein [Streptomyces sp. DSM 42041]MDT0377519.1 hypothetical protein [Streptomyces sp. DSM 42041]